MRVKLGDGPRTPLYLLPEPSTPGSPDRNFGSPAPLAKFGRPGLKLLESRLTNAGPDVDEAGLEVVGVDGPDLIHGRIEKGFAEVAERAHGCVLGEGSDVGAGEAW